MPQPVYLNGSHTDIMPQSMQTQIDDLNRTIDPKGIERIMSKD